MKRRRLFSILTLAGAWLAFNAGPAWTQTTPTPGKSQTEKNDTVERTGEEKMKARGTEADHTERKKGEEEMEARGAQKPGRMGKSGAEGAKESQSEGWATQDVKRAQEALKNKGHDPGSVDGVIGPQTRQAIKAFQSANGFNETGRLDAETAKKLEVEKGTPSRESTPKQKEEPSLPAGK